MPEVFGVLDDLVRAGKLRHYGVSVEKVEEGLKAIEYPGVQSVQVIYNMLRQRPGRAAASREAQRRGVGILARLPLSSGLLTGKLTRREPAFAADDHRHFNRARRRLRSRRDVLGRRVTARAWRRWKRCVPWCRRARAWRRWRLRWIQMNPAVTCSIPGCRRRAQVDENVAAADLAPLPEANTMNAVAEIYERHAKPHVHARW